MQRTEDGRFKDYRVKISKVLLNKILSEVKLYNCYSWKEFSKHLDVSEDTLRYDWRKKNTIPLTSLKSILKLHPNMDWKNIKNKLEILEPFWGQKIGKRIKHEKDVKLPNINTIEFAEFYGILLGDGCIYSNESGLCIAGNSISDKHYLEDYVSNLIKNLFGVKPKIYYSKNSKSMRCVLYNQKIVKFLMKIGFPAGLKRLNNPKIYSSFFKDKDLLKACIRGLQDTDGSVYNQANTKIILDISIKSNSLLKSTIKAFNKIKFDINFTHNRIYLCGKKNVLLFLKEFGTSNYRHIKKYDIFLKTGKIPLSLEIEKLLIGENKTKLKLPYYGSVV